MARIERDREATLKQDRDATALDRTMKRLDDEEREAQVATSVASAEEAVGWLQDLQALWAAVDACGWSETFGPAQQLIPAEMVAPAIGGDGRGERSRAYTFQMSVTVLDGDGKGIVSHATDVA